MAPMAQPPAPAPQGGLPGSVAMPGQVQTPGSPPVQTQLPAAGTPEQNGGQQPVTSPTTSVGQLGTAAGVNPFASGNYGATAPTSAGQQGTANDMGSAAQNLILGGLNNPNPNANSALTGGASQLAQSQVADPNPYNSSNIQQMMSVLNTPIVEQQQAALAAQNANAASRGIYDSNINSGALNDINTAAGRQQLSAADTLLQNAAQAQLQGTNSAISNAAGLQNQAFNQQQSSTAQALNNLLGYSGQEFGQQLSTAQQNLAQQNQQQNLQLQMLGLS